MYAERGFISERTVKEIVERYIFSGIFNAVFATGGKSNRDGSGNVTGPAVLTLNNATIKKEGYGAAIYIAAKAFKGSKNLSKVTISSNVKTIGKEAFSRRKKLKTVKKGVGKKANFKNI